MYTAGRIERMYFMIQCFAKNSFTSSFEEGTSPHLMSASYITIDFSQHARILHKHPDRLELLFIRSGSGHYIVDNTQYEIKAGNLIVTNAGVLHDEVPEHNRGLAMLSIAVDGVHVKGLPENHLIPSDIEPILKTEKRFVLIDAIFQELFDSLAFEEEQQRETNHYLTVSLLTMLINSFQRYGKINTDRIKENPLLREIQHYIDENYMEDLSLQGISEKFFISPSHLSHLFKKSLGYSPIHYIVRRRIGEAQSLLIMTPKPITLIATMVGFDNVSHFNVQFKKYVGLSPMAYRKKYMLPDSEDK